MNKSDRKAAARKKVFDSYAAKGSSAELIDKPVADFHEAIHEDEIADPLRAFKGVFWWVLFCAVLICFGLFLWWR